MIFLRKLYVFHIFLYVYPRVPNGQLMPRKADGPVLPLSAALAAQLSETCRDGCKVYGGPTLFICGFPQMRVPQ